MIVKGFRIKQLGVLALVGVASALSACVVAPPPRPAPPPPPAPNVTVYAYPQNGQSPQQLDRDRYECSNWATEQTGFNPSAPNTPPHDRVQVVGGPAVVPGSGVAVGAVTGGVLGAVASGPRDAGAGMLIGALIGGVLGGAAEATANANAQAAADNSANAQTRVQAAQIDRKAAEYRRALSACLSGRGYTVQ